MTVMLGIYIVEMVEVEKADRDFDSELAELYSVLHTTPPHMPSETLSGANVSESSSDDSRSLDVDFNALRAINDDIVGWIYQEGTKINYPVVQTTNNSLYLKKRFDSSDTEHGSIFADFRHDISSSNAIILYGHNTSRRTLEKFSSLIFYLENKDYIQEHPSFIFSDAATGEERVYDVFAVIKVNVSTQENADAYYREVSDEDLDEYIAFLQSTSLFKTDIEVTAEQKLLILSTCISGQSNYRCLVCCVERIQ